MSTILKCSWN